MPNLLNNFTVQLHMPKTGGTSLAEEKGLRDTCLGKHSGVEYLPTTWKKYQVVTTLRPKESWERSVMDYLVKFGKPLNINKFRLYKPKDARKHPEFFDLTFGFWDDKLGALEHLNNQHDFGSWYELYLHYYVLPADKIIPIHKLKLHKNKTG